VSLKLGMVHKMYPYYTVYLVPEPHVLGLWKLKFPFISIVVVSWRFVLWVEETILHIVCCIEYTSPLVGCVPSKRNDEEQ
jgi:hypothetical protein